MTDKKSPMLLLQLFHSQIKPSGMGCTEKLVHKLLPPRNFSTFILFNIYNVLADKGYTGETALTDYLLDYFNKEYGADCKSWSELTSAYPKIANEFAKTGTNGIRNMTYSELETLCEKHPEIDQNFIKVTTSSNPDQIGV